jgi:ABC-type nitrate/sulfonate/bicarbonate transport system permease component
MSGVKFIATVAVLVLIWTLVVKVGGFAKTTLPMPHDVLAALWRHPGQLADATKTTLVGAFGGFIVGNVVGVLLACLVAASQIGARIVLPLAIGIRVVPIVAIAPLLTLWLGRGMVTVVTVSGMLVFFPTLINGVLGLRSVEPVQLEMLAMVNASPLQVFIRLRLPLALPRLFAAFQIGAPTAVLGAMLAEWVASGQGLGHLILVAGASFDADIMWAGVVVATAIALLAAALAALLARSVTPWEHE